jgi:hypothetical protein
MEKPGTAMSGIKRDERNKSQRNGTNSQPSLMKNLSPAPENFLAKNPALAPFPPLRYVDGWPDPETKP